MPFVHHGVLVDVNADFLELTVDREITLATILGRKDYYVAIGEHFLDGPHETSLVYGGASHAPGDGFYSHIHRSLGSWMNVQNACIGLALATLPAAAGIPLVLRWKQRIVQQPPPSIIPVRCVQVNGVWTPDYTIAKWNASKTTTAPNAVQVTSLPGYVAEFWRLSKKIGGSRSAGSMHGAGMRYLPVFRGPATGTSDGWLFTRKQFDGCADTNPWRRYRVCYYNPATGARGPLSAETIVSAGDHHPDQHNGKGPVRYGLWINR